MNGSKMYYFQMNVWINLVPAVGNTEIVRSLRTMDLKAAECLSAANTSDFGRVLRMGLGMLALLVTVCVISDALAWSSGQADNNVTNEPDECQFPPYATHDWIAEHALDLLPDGETAWIKPHLTMYLLGTEAPDNDNIPSECGGPHKGYGDNSQGHSVEWKADQSDFKNDRAARRAQEEYGKASSAYETGNYSDAAFYLGAMAHYIGDLTQYGHSISFQSKRQHFDYEIWVARRTASFDDGVFEKYIVADKLETWSAYEAAKRTSRVIVNGNDKILSAVEMNDLLGSDSQEYLDSIGESLGLGVNELANVLHYFYLNIVSQHP